MIRRNRIWATGFGLALLATATLNGTAAMADDSPSISASIADVTMGGAGSPGKVVFVFLNMHGVQNPTITFDASDLAGIAHLGPLGSDCTTAGASTTCPLPSMTDMADRLPIVLLPDAAAHAGDHGTLKITTAGDNVTSSTSTGNVTIADGVDLVVLDPPLKADVKVGDVVTATTDFYNAGDKTAKGLQVTVDFDHGLVPAAYDGCRYADENSHHIVTCQAPDVTIEPGTFLEVNFDAKVARDASKFQNAETLVEGIGEDTSALSTLAFKARPRSGRTLTFKTVSAAAPQPKDIDSGDNYGELQVTVVNSHLDAAAIGATTSGNVGDVVPVTIGVKNNGPAALDDTHGGDTAVQFTFSVPAGTTTVAVPANCDAIIDNNGVPTPVRGKTGADYYRCFAPTLFLDAGQSTLTTFKLKITQLTSAGTKGAASLNDKDRQPQVYQDDNAADNTADVTVSLPANSGGSGGGLPITGAPTALIVAAGALALVLGAALTLLGRRRTRRDLGV
ncbi:MAG TPA: hypothetical protein VJT31_28860 [Rugosimonospora sp.]|nr:hypothetical protein [Rugosimonospora sp.]